MFRLFPLLLVVFLGTAGLVDAASTASRGMELLRQGRYRQATEPLRQARKAAPRDPGLKQALAESYLGAGAELLQGGELAEAAAMFTAGRELKPDDGRFSLLLGFTLLKQGDAETAEARLVEALQQSGPSPEVYRLLAQACYADGRLYEAQSYLEQGLDLQPEAAEEDQAFLAKIRLERTLEEKMTNRRAGNFSLSYVEGGKRLGAQTLNVLDEAYAELGTLFNAYPDQTVAVILYGKKDFFQVTGAPDWAGGAYDGKIRVPVGGLREMNHDLRRVLYHEYAHVLIRSLTGGNVPRWLNEGLAQAAEGEEPAGQAAALNRVRQSVGAVPFERLAGSFEGLSAAQAGAAYLQSRDFVLYLLDHYGWPRMLDLLEALGQGKPFDEAFDRFLLYDGEDFWMVEEDWRERDGWKMAAEES